MQFSKIVALGLATVAHTAVLPTTPVEKSELEARQYPGAVFCSDRTDYEVSSQKVIKGDWQAVSGNTCTSSKLDSCSVGKSDSVSIGVSISVGAGLDLGKIFHLSSDVSWSYTKTKADTVTQTCPKGGYVCGLIYQPTLMHVKGKKILVTTGNCGSSGDKKGGGDYEFDAPYLIDGKPEVRYAACISDASENKDIKATGIDKCPEGL